MNKRAASCREGYGDGSLERRDGRERMHCFGQRERIQVERWPRSGLRMLIAWGGTGASSLMSMGIIKLIALSKGMSLVKGQLTSPLQDKQGRAK